MWVGLKVVSWVGKKVASSGGCLVSRGVVALVVCWVVTLETSFASAGESARAMEQHWEEVTGPWSGEWMDLLSVSRRACSLPKRQSPNRKR